MRGGVEKKVCRVCRKGGEFSLSRVRRRDWICTICNNKKNDKDPARYLARKLASMLYNRGEHGPFPGTDFARQVVSKYKSYKEDDLKRLCISKIDWNGPWTVENAALVTPAESGAMTRKKNKGQLIV